jgi:hypothetical protein
MRVLLGTQEIAGQIADLAAGFRELGHETFTVVREVNPFFSDAAYDLVGGYDVVVPRVDELIDRHDAFFFQFGMSLQPRNADLPRIQAAGKRLISLFNGDDIRHPSAYLQQYGVETTGLGPHYRGDPLARPIFRLRMAERHADLIVSVPNQSGLALRPYQHFFYPLALGRYRCEIHGRAVPVVVHAPSQKGLKGTSRILEALERVRKAGVRFELRLLENVQNREVRDALTTADVVIDQIYFPFGKLAAEGMACGCAVASAHRPDIEPFAARRPVWRLDDRDLESQLESLLTDRPLRVRLAEAGRRHAEDYHDHVRVAAQILDGCEAARDGRLAQYDYYPTFFAREYRIPDGQDIPDECRRLGTMIVERFGLPAGVALDSLVERGLISHPRDDGTRPGPTWPADPGGIGSMAGVAAPATPQG